MTLMILGICLVGALLELDTTYAFQLTFSRGIIAGPLLGLLTGDVMTGLQVGIFTELLFIDINPLGGLLPPSGAVCCAVSMVLCALGIAVYFSFFVGVLSAIFFSLLEILVRKYRMRWISRQEQKILTRPDHLTRTVWQELFLSFSLTFLFIWIAGTFSGAVLTRVITFLPEQIHIASRFAFMAVPWIGMATLIPIFRLKTR